jgi:hypothetical protein
MGLAVSEMNSPSWENGKDPFPPGWKREGIESRERILSR